MEKPLFCRAKVRGPDTWIQIIENHCEGKQVRQPRHPRYRHPPWLGTFRLYRPSASSADAIISCHSCLGVHLTPRPRIRADRGEYSTVAIGEHFPVNRFDARGFFVRQGGEFLFSCPAG